MKRIPSQKKIELIANAALARKAGDVVLMDLRKLPSVCDYFVVTSGESTTQIGSISDNIEKQLSRHGYRLWHREGKAEALWILLDYGDIVVHIFYKDTRGFYYLEKLSHDAPQRTLTDSSVKKRRTHAKKKRRV